MRDSTYASVCSTVAAYFDVDPTHVKPEQWLRADWGLDAIELDVLAHRIEQVERIAVRGHGLDSVQTVGQLINPRPRIASQSRADETRRLTRAEVLAVLTVRPAYKLVS